MDMRPGRLWQPYDITLRPNRCLIIFLYTAFHVRCCIEPGFRPGATLSPFAFFYLSHFSVTKFPNGRKVKRRRVLTTFSHFHFAIKLRFLVAAPSPSSVGHLISVFMSTSTRYLMRFVIKHYILWKGFNQSCLFNGIHTSIHNNFSSLFREKNQIWNANIETF